MKTHTHTLEKHKGPATKYTCPQCGVRRKFTRYIDTATGQYLADHVGRCDRQDSCQYHYRPAQFFRESGMKSDWRPAPRVKAIGETFRKVKVKMEEPAVTSYIAKDVFFSSRTGFSGNHFIQWLYSRYEREVVIQAIQRYRIAQSQRWPGATVWWQIDREERIRTGKVMLYDPQTGKRIKEPYAHIGWVHTEVGGEGFGLRQCLYGEHLLHYDEERPVAIVESEKTAVIASIHMPHLLWLACGGKEGLTADKLEVLRGRNVVLYPDQGSAALWTARARELSDIVHLRMNDMMERVGRDGEDIGDYLVRESDERKERCKEIAEMWN